MPDTGAKAGQQVEFAVKLTQNGSALSYADKTAFTAAGWDLIYRAAQTTQSATYTVQPHTDTDLANEGYHLFLLTVVNGAGPVLLSEPTTGSGWQASPKGVQAAYETHDVDDVYAQINETNGVVLAGTNITQTDFDLIEGQSWTAEITVSESPLTAWGLDSEDLGDGTLTLHGEVRAPDNRGGQDSPDAIPNAYLSIVATTAVAGSNGVLRLSLPEYPVAVATVIEGMELASGDADVSGTAYNYDVEARYDNSMAITAVGTGAGGTFTVSGDQRRYFAQGIKFTVSGSSNNDGEWTTISTALSGGDTVVTVASSESVGAVADGNIVVSIEIPLAKGILNVTRQETRN